MKKSFRKNVFLIVFVCMTLFVTSCGKKKPQEGDEEPKKQIDLTEVCDFVHSTVKNQVVEEVVLPTTYTQNDLDATITWTSNKPEVIGNDGVVKSNQTKKEEVEFTFVVQMNETTKEDTLKVIVYPKTLDEVGLEFENQFPEQIAGNVNVQTSFYEDYKVNWTVTPENILDESGNFVQPEKDTTIQLNYTVQLTMSNQETISKNYQKELLVKGQPSVSEQNKKVEIIDKWINETVAVNAVSDITLPKTYLEENQEVGTIVWSTSDSTHLTKDGKVTRNRNRIITVKLTYTIQYYQTTKKGEITVTIYPKTLEQISASFIANIPDFVSNDLILDTDFGQGYTVAWTSSNPEVLQNDGKIIKPQQDIEVTISYVVQLKCTNGEIMEKEYTYKTICGAYSDVEKVDLALEWLENTSFTELNLTKDVFLPTTDAEFGIAITWTSSNNQIVNAQTGNVYRNVYDRYVCLTAQLVLNNSIKQKEFWCVVEALDISKMTEQEILEKYISSIATEYTTQVSFTKYDNITQSWGFLSFFMPNSLKISEKIAPLSTENRPGTIKTSTNFVVVHDTANNGATANALAHANYISDGGGGTSWHYSVDQDGAYHQLPDNEVAYHAGDGHRYFKLIDTGVKATVRRPNIGIDSEYYFTFNGVRSQIQFTERATTTITPSGLYYEIGENGNYWLNDTYYNSTYFAICNRGGNYNSIGIETCVNNGSDYTKTARNNARLVAKLLIENKLTVDAVMQHNNMSGKDCPAAIRSFGWWQNFRDLISMEKFGQEHYNDLTFEWKSGSDIMDDTGIISLNLQDQTSVNYSLVVKKNNQEVIYSQTFTTSLKKR